MTSLQKRLSLVVGLTLLVTISVLGGARLLRANPSPVPAPAPAPPPGPPSVPVNVVNTPLPITGNVNVANTPLPVSGSVSAAQSGSWSVGVNNLPAIQSVTFNGAQPVSFSNTLTTPLFNSDRDNPARQPVIGACDFPNVIPPGGFMLCTVLLSTGGSQLLTTVPAGQELVIETVTGFADMPTGTIPIRFDLDTTVSGASTGFFFVPQKVGAENSGVDDFIVSQQVRLYADPGTTVQFQFLPNTNLQISAGIKISGYLVKLP